MRVYDTGRVPGTAPKRDGQGQSSDQLCYSRNGHCTLPWDCPDNSQGSGWVPPLRNKQILFAFLLRVWLESSASDSSQVDLSPTGVVPMCVCVSVHMLVSSAALSCKGILSCWEKEKPFLKKPHTTQTPTFPTPMSWFYPSWQLTATHSSSSGIGEGIRRIKGKKTIKASFIGKKKLSMQAKHNKESFHQFPWAGRKSWGSITGKSDWAAAGVLRSSAVT